MQRANVAVYAIDPSGPNGLTSYVQSRIGSLATMHEYTQAPIDPQTQEATVRPCNTKQPTPLIPVCFVPEASFFGQFIGGLGNDFLRTASENTGGRATVGNENFDEAIAQMFEENARTTSSVTPRPRRTNPARCIDSR